MFYIVFYLVESYEQRYLSYLESDTTNTLYIILHKLVFWKSPAHSDSEQVDIKIMDMKFISSNPMCKLHIVRAQKQRLIGLWLK